MLRFLAAALGLSALALAGPASAATDLSGSPIPNTSTLSETAQLEGDPSLLRLLAAPSSPDDDDAAALAALGAPDGPEEDLAAALDRLAAAPTAADAAAARRFALDVLEGAPLDRAYSGIPLLNWNSPAKVKDVEAGGTVTVRQVRFGDHVVSDTWLLRFADPRQPFEIAYEVTELGGAFGGELTPTPLLADGTTPVGGMNAAIAPLALPELETGTLTTSRFHPHGADEHSRLGTQRIVVRMPPPRNVAAILDPSRAAGLQDRTTTGEIPTATRALATLAPATDDRLAAAVARAGF
ncbi:MAG TPA: hypothetical protein VHF88_06595, partial [Thermoleophilaceae bacterium]|nr:hypothetical protein [Thermoleophilaceae bacterium]